MKIAKFVKVIFYKIKNRKNVTKDEFVFFCCDIKGILKCMNI